MLSVSSKVKKEIENKGLKQSYVAQKIGMNPKTFNGLLNGRKTFDVSYLIPICKAIGISPNELLGFSEESKIGWRVRMPIAIWIWEHPPRESGINEGRQKIRPHKTLLKCVK